MKMMKTMAAAASAVMIVAMSVASITASAAIEFDADNKVVPVDKGPYSAYLCLQAGADTQCKPGDLDGAECEFSTNGSYSVSATMKNGSGTVELMTLETNLNAYSYAPVKASCKEGSLPDGCTVSIKIDSIEVKQKASGSSYTIDYKGPSDGALRLSDNDSTVRVNILNQWTDPKVADIEKNLSAKGGLAAGDVVTVNFTVSGIAGGGNGGGGQKHEGQYDDQDGDQSLYQRFAAGAVQLSDTTASFSMVALSGDQEIVVVVVVTSRTQRPPPLTVLTVGSALFSRSVSTRRQSLSPPSARCRTMVMS